MKTKNLNSLKVTLAIIMLALTLCMISTSFNAFAQTWSQLPTSGNPPSRSNASAIYVTGGNRMLVFGGKTSSGNLNDFWSLNLNTNVWQNITPTSGSMPTPRFTSNAVYDSLLNRMIIWSGQGTELYNDVWAFNLNNNSWQQLWPDGNVSGAPLKRYGTAAVFDPLNKRIINFAGFTTSGRFEDTWYFQVDSMRWNDKTNSFHPEMRCLHSACITKDNQSMFIYGGQHNGALDDLWTLNLNTFIWSELTPSIKPAGRWFTSIICTEFEKIVFFGGQSSSSIFGDLWKFNLTANSWDSISQGAMNPSARYGHTAVYIPSSDRMIIFGGFDTDFKNDTWQFTNISPIGINELNGNIPKNFKLYQNYPNPFNPKTIINYQLSMFSGRSPSDNFVSLKVYNNLGNEVAVLVNEKQSAGAYEVDFDGSNFPSGVYFYKIEISNDKSQKVFTDTKKMIVVK